jgi:hypothetical protein
MPASSAASCVPSAIVWPTYGVRENGALTATRSDFCSELSEPFPPQAEANAQRARMRARRFRD